MKFEEPLSLSLANLLQEDSPIPWIRKTTKSYSSWSSDSLKKQMLSWKWKVRYANWSVNNNVSTQDFESDANAVNWEDLPVELWWEIGKRLMSPLDILVFRSVCKNFRSSLPRPSRFPLWVPPLPRGGNTVPCVITQVSIYTRECLVFEEVERGGWFYAHRMYTSIVGTRKTFIPYMRVNFVSAAYHLRVAVPRPENRKLWDFRYNSSVSKMVIISSNTADAGVNSCYASQLDLSIIARVSKGTMKGRLALLRLGGPRGSWAWDTDFCTQQLFQDIAIYRGQLCALDANGGVVIMDLPSKSCVQLSPPWPRFSKMTHAYIFEDGGDLYVSDFSNLQRIKSYKLNLQKRMWVRVEVSFDALFPFFHKAGKSASDIRWLSRYTLV